MSVSPEVGRFAPSTTGPAHPGTLLAALLCWLDARSRGARVWLRFEDLDPGRSRAEWLARMRSDLDWLGLDWDGVETQSQMAARHEAALDRLARRGLLYPCACSRSTIRAGGVRTPDGGFRYPGTCRGRSLPAAGWRASLEPIRAQLAEGRLAIEDESGLDLSQDPVDAFGDPLVRRRDGAIAYHLASVVDDAAAGVTRVVRGRDLASSTASQVALQRALDLPEPRYRHHLLVLEEHGGKLAKFHGAVDVRTLRVRYDAAGLCGVLAWAAGLLPEPSPALPSDLLEEFSWKRVFPSDRVLRWTGDALILGDEPGRQ
jgi:glutamyl/glutaminyl-tRNA synthetase